MSNNNNNNNNNLSIREWYRKNVNGILDINFDNIFHVLIIVQLVIIHIN